MRQNLGNSAKIPTGHRKYQVESNMAVKTHSITKQESPKGDFNWAAKGLFFLRGGGGYTHSGYYKTLSPTIACDRISCETET